MDVFGSGLKSSKDLISRPQSSRIKLRHFGFDEANCRFPSCSRKDNNQRNLYLCCEHRDKLAVAVKRICNKYSVDAIAIKDVPENVDTEDFMKIIGTLDAAYRKQSRNKNSPETGLRFWKEVLLNTRNVLLVSKSLMSSNHGNSSMILHFVCCVLMKLISLRRNERRRFDRFCSLMRDGSGMIFHAYGIIYEWLSLPCMTDTLNPGRSIGLGVGGMVGGLLAGVILIPLKTLQVLIDSSVNKKDTSTTMIPLKNFVFIGALLGATVGSYLGNWAYWFYDNKSAHKEHEKIKEEYISYVHHSRPPGIRTMSTMHLFFISARKRGVSNPDNLEIAIIS